MILVIFAIYNEEKSISHLIKDIRNTLKKRAPLWKQYLNKKELAELLHFAYKRFYICLHCILRNLFSIKTLSELNRIAKGDLRILYRY